MDIKKQDLIDQFGSVIKAAEFFGIKRQTIYMWPDNKPVKKGYVMELRVRRPDIYDALVNK